MEGRNPHARITKPDVAYSRFILELLESLPNIFGGSKRCTKFYEYIYEVRQIPFEIETQLKTLACKFRRTEYQK